MDINNIKNMVILKNLPSNLIDEAIVILKSNKMAKKFKYLNDNSISSDNSEINSKEYIIKEAEMVISNYISNVELQKEKSYKDIKKIEKNSKKFKILAYVFIALFFLSLLF